MPKRATILDVAKAAGVSKATVSRVLAGDYPVAKPTAQRVREAVEELGYTASSRARSLATGRSDAFAVIISEPLDVFFADPTFARIVQGITDALSDTRVVPILLPTATPQEQGKAYRLITNQTVDAVIHLSPWSDQGLLDSLASEHVPTVVCGQDEGLEKDSPFSFVYSDDRLGAVQAAERVQAAGRTNPVAILGKQDQPAATDRLKGYQEVFDCLSDERIRWGDWSERAGADAMRSILDAGLDLDAVLAGSDRIARGAIEVLRRAGRNVPAHVSVIGYDDHPTAMDRSPALTTIAQPMHAQGEAACRLAQDMVEGAPARTIILPTELKDRETV